MKSLIKITVVTFALLSSNLVNGQITETVTPTTDRLSNSNYTDDNDSGKLGLFGLIGLLGLLGLRRNRTRDELDQNRTTTTTNR